MAGRARGLRAVREVLGDGSSLAPVTKGIEGIVAGSTDHVGVDDGANVIGTVTSSGPTVMLTEAIASHSGMTSS